MGKNFSDGFEAPHLHAQQLAQPEQKSPPKPPLPGPPPLATGASWLLLGRRTPEALGRSPATCVTLQWAGRRRQGSSCQNQMSACHAVAAWPGATEADIPRSKEYALAGRAPALTRRTGTRAPTTTSGARKMRKREAGLRQYDLPRCLIAV